MEHGGIDGVVRDRSGAVVADATVSLGEDSPPHRDIAARTGDDGRFRFGRLVPGDYTVVVRVEGLGTVTETVTVPAGEVVRLEMTSAGP